MFRRKTSKVTDVPKPDATRAVDTEVPVQDLTNLDPQGFFKNILGLAKITCMMPLYSKSRFKNRLHLAWMLFVWGWTMLHFSSQMMDLVVSHSNITRIAQNLAFSICLANNMARASTVLWQPENVKRLMHNIATFYRRESENKGGEKVTIAKYERAALLWFQVYVLSCLIAMPLFIFGPFAIRIHFGVQGNSTDDGLPTKAWYPFDEKSKTGYIAAYVIQAPPILMGSAMLVAGDSFCVRIMALTAGQLHLIRHEIRNIRNTAIANILSRKPATAPQQPPLSDDSTNKVNDGELQLEIEKELRNLAVIHGKVLDQIHTMEGPLSIIALANSRSLTVCLVTTAFEIMNSEVITIPRLVAIGIYLFTAILFVLVYSLAGDQLLKEQDQIHQELYETPWLDASLTYQKNMRFMGDRSRIPVKISVGKLAILNLETYVTEMNRAFSTFNGMLQLRNIEQQRSESTSS